VVYPTVAEETNAKITEAVKKILAKKAFPIYFGRGSQHHVPGGSRLRHSADYRAH